MVLQRDTEIDIHGKSSGQKVKVIFAGKEYESHVSEGKFSVKLPAQPFGGPHVIVIQETPSGERKVLSNVLFGDVFICSGQSNMRWTINQSNNPAAEIQESLKYPNVRHFFVQTTASPVEVDDLKGSVGWSLPSNTTTGSFSAVCWSFGRSLNKRVNIPIGLIHSSVGGTRIELWMSKDVVNGCKSKDTEVINQPSYLYNGMIHPLRKYKVTGALWYQGESNARDPAGQYLCKKKLMIQDWRKKISNVGLFAYVQLAGYNGDFVAIRWEQHLLQQQVQGAVMATAIDIGHKTDIHPRNKREVGERLQLIAARVLHGQRILYYGPIINKLEHSRSGNSFSVKLSMNEEIELKPTENCATCCQNTLEMYELVGANNQVYPTNLKFENLTISLTATIPSNVEVKNIRYSWKKFVECVVFGKRSRLPSSPFFYNIDL